MGLILAPLVSSASVAAQTAPTAVELGFWRSIKASTDVDEYRAYVRQFPKGIFLPLAEARIARLERGASAEAATVLPSAQSPRSGVRVIVRDNKFRGLERLKDEFRCKAALWHLGGSGEVYRAPLAFEGNELVLTARVLPGRQRLELVCGYPDSHLGQKVNRFLLQSLDDARDVTQELLVRDGMDYEFVFECSSVDGSVNLEETLEKPSRR